MREDPSRAWPDTVHLAPDHRGARTRPQAVDPCTPPRYLGLNYKAVISQHRYHDGEEDRLTTEAPEGPFSGMLVFNVCEYNTRSHPCLHSFRCGVSNGVITTTLVALASLQPTEVTNLRLRPHQGRLRANSMQQHLQAATLSISFPSNIGPLPSTRVHRLVQERRTRSPLHDAHRRRHSDRRSFLRGRYPPRRVAQPLIMTNPPLSQHCLRPTNTRTEPLRGTAPRCRWAVAVVRTLRINIILTYTERRVNVTERTVYNSTSNVEETSLNNTALPYTSNMPSITNSYSMQTYSVNPPPSTLDNAVGRGLRQTKVDLPTEGEGLPPMVAEPPHTVVVPPAINNVNGFQNAMSEQEFEHFLDDVLANLKYAPAQNAYQQNAQAGYGGELVDFRSSL